MRSWIGLSLGLVFVLGAVGLFVGSPWLTWYLLEDDTTRVVITDETVSQLLKQELGIRELLSGQGKAVFAGGIYQRMDYNLRHWSWDKSWQALRTTIYAPVPISPALLASFDIANEKVVLVGVIDNNTLKILSSSSFQQLGQTPLILSVDNKMTDTTSDEVMLDVPGIVLGYLSAQVSDEWNKELLAALSFKNTQPDIIGELARYSRIVIRIGETSAAIGIEGTSKEKAAFKNKLKEWLEDEERYGRPVRQAFKLPDGTLGYELVPGDREAVLEAEGECMAPLGDDKSALWVCNAMAGTSHQAALYVAGKLEWQALLRGDSANQLPGIREVWAGGTKDRSLLIVSMTP